MDKNQRHQQKISKNKIQRNCDFKEWFPDCFQLPAAEAVLLTITDVAEERGLGK
jgi:PIN domain nuclease of toxin-antitoxin system